jgi:hypothetical protein
LQHAIHEHAPRARPRRQASTAPAVTVRGGR